MDASGYICSERAPDKRGKALAQGLEYERSLPLISIPIQIPSKDRVTWVTEVEVHSGYFTFSQNPEDQVIKTCRTYGVPFQAHTLERVNNDTEGDSFAVQEDFYPVLYKMLRNKQDWKNSVYFRGRATFELGTMEWTESVLKKFAGSLKSAEIFGAVGVSRFPYHYCSNIWKAFCELWGPLTNTLHHGNGEMSISLHDLKLIGGLPILGLPYEEFIPVNDELHRNEPIVAELLRVHSQLCSYYGKNFIYWDQWIRHFYRGQLLYAAYGEVQRRVTRSQQGRANEKHPSLEISGEGELAAYLAYWLSRFVLPSNNSKIRPETFRMACVMAKGIKVSLAPSVLGNIYHGLGMAVTDPRGPGTSNACFPIHYVIGWLGEYFPCLYRCRADSEFPTNYPRLARYAGVEAVDLDISSSRLIFRTDKSVIYRPSPFIEEKGLYLFDNEDLSDEQFELLVCMRSLLLPVRMGRDLWLEPYYPNRFARQFGLDQGVPVNKLSFGLAKRQRCCIEDLARAQSTLLQTNTGVRFYIPRSTYEGVCTYTYCRWWMRACTPYLGLSVSNVYLTLTKRPLERREHVFVIRSIREVSSDLQKEVLFSEEARERTTANVGKCPPTSKNVSQSSHTRPSSKSDELKKLKRHRHEKCHDIDEVAIGQKSASGKSHKDTSLRTHTMTSSKGDTRPTTRANSARHKNSDDIIEQKESKFQALKLSFKETEAKFQHEDDSQREGNSESASGGTEPIDLDTCTNEDVYEDVSAPNETISSLYNIFDLNVNGRRRDLILVEMQDILNKITSSQPPAKILDHREEVSATIIMLRSMIDTLGSGKSEFEWFAKTIDHTFELADHLSQNISIIEKGAGIDIAHIHDLIRRHEECQEAKRILDLQLLDFVQQLTELKATEHSVIEAEKQAQRLREAYKTAQVDLEEKIKSLKESSESQNKLDEELRQARIDAQEDKLPEFEHAEHLYKSHTMELDKQIKCLKSFGRRQSK